MQFKRDRLQNWLVELSKMKPYFVAISLIGLHIVGLLDGHINEASVFYF